ncbi:CHASE2 domain-containing protein [Candidatus Woesearchaeota archaeon]|nr:CHASE2 domain-containing protein [Candidatus Woesearchaeota archaeon]
MKNRLKAAIGISIACAIILSFLFNIGYLSNINLKLTDNLYGGQPALNSIVIAAIDDKSLQEIGRWPWEREVFADIINFLNESKTIGIDVAFFEPSTKEQDEKLGQAITNSGKVILPVEYTSFEKQNSQVIGKDLMKPPEEIRQAKGYGYINVITDRDGVTRAVNMNVSDQYDNFANVVYEN